MIADTIVGSETMLEALQSMEFTQGLEPRHLMKLAALATRVTFEEGEIIFREGDMGKMIYLVEEGRVALRIRVPNRNQVTIKTVKSDQLLGWSSLFSPYHKTADARAVVATRAIAINAPELWLACQEDHDLGYTIMVRVAEAITSRLIATRLQLMDIFG